jgi:hypothetical protein
MTVTMTPAVRNRLVLTAVALLAVAIGAAALACGESPKLVQDAVGEDPAAAKAAVATLRAQGPAGLRRLIYASDLDTALTTRNSAPTPAEIARGKRFAAAIDAVAAQKDASASRLYWYTDFDQAKAAAAREGKPILSLRLLGNLDSEFSCANSRFFRTVLYADAEVGKALRDRFVLHWKSVRPVPKVTIDMGDGRTICRTITGNSIHYVLDAQGRVVDALPGLYGAKPFLRGLDAAEREERELRKAGGDVNARAARLAQWHGDRVAATETAWSQDLRSLGMTDGPVPVKPRMRVVTIEGTKIGNPPSALVAAPLAPSKVAVEWNIVRALAPRFAALETSTDIWVWTGIAALPPHAEDGRLGEGSRAMVRAKQATRAPSARAAGLLTVGKALQEDPVLRVTNTFERSVAEDTVRNEYGFHRKIHEWFATRAPDTTAAEDPGALDRLNERVYSELFLTPSSDPWLGLVPDDAYSALEGRGTRNAE